MVNLALVGRCGIYCGACGAYRVYRDKDAPYFHQVVEELFADPLEKLRCEGCHALTPSCAGFDCKTVRCLDSKGYEYCYKCPEYETHSCNDKFEELAANCVQYGMDLRANLKRIKAGEVEAWVEECERKFSCPKCGNPSVVFGWRKNVKKKCYHCGSELME